MRMAWVVWYYDMANKSTTLDSIWTNHDDALKQIEHIKEWQDKDPYNFDRLTYPLIAEFELNKDVGLDLDITVERDANGRQIEHVSPI